MANRTLERGDIFFGGEDSEDWWLSVNYGTFYCGPGDDWVGLNYGTFYGDADLDQVRDNYGTFNGGEGNDYVVESNNGTLVQ